MRKLATLIAIVSATAVLASSCGGGAQPGATPGPAATTAPRDERSAAAIDDAGELRPGAWVEVVTQADCVDVYMLPPFPEGDIVSCLPSGFVGMLAGESIKAFPPATWWPLAAQGWVQERDIRFHHIGDLPYPPPDPSVSLAGEIAFRGPDGGLWLMTADASNRRRLTEAPDCIKGCSLAPALWSPDGQMIVLEKKSQEVNVVDSSGQTIFNARCSDPVWAPTSSLLAVSCINTYRQVDLSILDLDGEVVHNIPSASITNWASDGRRLALVRWAWIEGDDWDMRVLPAIFDLDSGELTPLEDEILFSELQEKGSPTWSPNGSWLAYDWRLTNVDTGAVRELPGPVTSWSPDGRFLLLDDTQIYDLEKELTISELELPAPLPRSSEPPAVLAPRLFAWSPDGRFAVQFIRPQDAQGAPSVLRVVELESGDVRTIAIPAPPSRPAISPDGEYLVFSPEVNVTLQPQENLFPQPEGNWIWLVRLNGSGLTLLAEGTQPVWRPQPKESPSLAAPGPRTRRPSRLPR